METKRANQKDLIQLQSIIDLIAEYNKQDNTSDYLFLSFVAKEKGLSPEEINKIVYTFCMSVNIPIHELIGESRKMPLPDFRAMLAFYLRNAGVKLGHIAEIIKWADHSTVFAAVKKHCNLYCYDKQYQKTYDKFLTDIQNGND